MKTISGDGFEGEGSSILAVLFVGAASAAELDSLIATTFARCANARAALLIKAEQVADFAQLATTLRAAMLQPSAMRPTAVSIVVASGVGNLARDLSLGLAHEGLVLGDFTDTASAKAHALRERALVLAEESSASNVLRVRSIRAAARARRSLLRASRRWARDRDLGVSRMLLDA